MFNVSDFVNNRDVNMGVGLTAIENVDTDEKIVRLKFDTPKHIDLSFQEEAG